MKFPYTKAQFAEWLKAHANSRFTQGNPHKCPLARALQAAFKGKQASFVAGSFWLKDKGAEVWTWGEYHTAPRWAATFARKFDCYPNERKNTLTGEQALKILGSIK